MIKNYLKIAVRNILRQKTYSFINIIGFSIGIACCILIVLFVRDELSYDTFNTNADSIVRVLQVEREPNGELVSQDYQPMPLVPALKSEYPEILHAARFSTGGTIVTYGDKAFQETIMFTDPDVFSMFDIKFISGNPKTALVDPSEIVITKETADKYFGNEQPMGKALNIKTPGGTQSLIVAGVVEEMPSNSTLQFNFLANLQKHRMYERAKDRWTSSNGSAYLMLRKSVKPEELQAKLPVFVQKYFGEIIKRYQSEGYLSKEKDPFKFLLQPLKDVHLDTSVKYSSVETGNPTNSYILGGIALLVLLIACINFVTLTIGRSANRAKEVGVRKVLGAERLKLIRQFWSEAVLFSAIAMIIGIAIAGVLLPSFNQLAGKKLFMSFTDFGLIGTLFVLMLLIGLISGIYPALFLSRFEPISILKGKFKIGGRNFFTKALIVFQFSLSILLICSALVLSEQLHFVINSNLGFHPHQVAVLPAYSKAGEAETITNRLRVEVQGDPRILNISLTSGAFTHGYDISGFKYNDKNKNAFVYRIDENFLPTLKIPLVEGRNFIKGSAEDRDHGMIVNEAFVKSMGWTLPAVGKELTGTDDKQLAKLHVIGVVKDFHNRSFHEEIRPAIMFMLPDWPQEDILIRIAPSDIPQTVAYLKTVWQKINPDTPFDLTFLDHDFQKLYESEMKWGEIINYSSALAVILACLGLFGLVTISITNRAKEIGIRMVLGASGPGILKLISSDFLKLVLLANIIAWPAAYWAATKYLEEYAYRISLTPTIFILAGLMALVISFTTIAAQIIKVSRSNPVDALRYE